MVDKQHLAELFLDAESNREQIQLALYDIAGLVSGKFTKQARNREDLQHDIFIHLQKRIDSFDTGRKSNPYSFFYKAAENCLLTLIGTKYATKEASPSLTEFSNPEQVRPVKQTYKDDAVLKKDKKTINWAVRRLDKCLDECTEAIGLYDLEDYLYGGIAFLQQYRLILCNQYKPLELPRVIYTLDKKIPHGKE